MEETSIGYRKIRRTNPSHAWRNKCRDGAARWYHRAGIHLHRVRHRRRDLRRIAGVGSRVDVERRLAHRRRIRNYGEVDLRALCCDPRRVRGWPLANPKVGAAVVVAAVALGIAPGDTGDLVRNRRFASLCNCSRRATDRLARRRPALCLARIYARILSSLRCRQQAPVGIREPYFGTALTSKP